MRLDKFLCDALGTTRKESTQLLKSGDVTVDGIVR
ncbi:MAG: S4 domain-containing protein, partial [Vibrio metschnikovii]